MIDDNQPKDYAPLTPERRAEILQDERRRRMRGARYQGPTPLFRAFVILVIMAACLAVVVFQEAEASESDDYLESLGICLAVFSYDVKFNHAISNESAKTLESYIGLFEDELLRQVYQEISNEIPDDATEFELQEIDLMMRGYLRLYIDAAVSDYGAPTADDRELIAEMRSECMGLVGTLKGEAMFRARSSE